MLDDALRQANLAAALEHAQAGIAVFPARAVRNPHTGRWDKRPLIKGWQAEAGTDESKIKGWWKDYPDAVPGLVLGRGKLIVIDADRHGGPDGVAELARLAASHGGLPLCPMTHTAGDGEHYYFLQPDGENFGNSSGGLPAGIDVRGTGGWIVAPGAVRADGMIWTPAPDTPALSDAYRSGTVPGLPDWLAPIIRSKRNSKVINEEAPNPTARERAFAAAALKGCFERVSRAEPGGRNNALNQAAYHLGRMIARDWIDLHDVVDQMREAARRNGLLSDDGEDAVQATLASGLTAGRKCPHEDLRQVSDNAEDKGGSPDQASVKAWPILDSTAAQGLIGAIAKLATRESEADPVAVMATTLAWGAACFGRNRFYRVGDTNHHARLFLALVGASSRARKGTSLGPVERIFREAERILQSRSTLPFPSGLPLNVSHGLSSGEGLIAEIRDERDEEDGGGVEDKRLLVVEGEFGAVLRQFQRQGNTLSSTLRNAWDGRDLGTMTKSSRDRATDPHVCLIGHITRQELDALLTSADIWNGVANRFLWAAVRRNKLVPFAQPMPDDEVAAIGAELANAIQYAHGRDRMDAELTMSNSARDHWMAIYPELTEDHPGLLGAVTSRAEAQVLRLAMDFAQFDAAARIELQHLEAALCFWRYSFDSAAYIFEGAEIDPMAQQIVEALAKGAKTQTDIVNLFGRNVPKDRLDGVLKDLQDRGRITLTKESGTGGRPRSVWRLAL